MEEMGMGWGQLLSFMAHGLSSVISEGLKI